jgi:hypothetical protein
MIVNSCSSLYGKIMRGFNHDYIIPLAADFIIYLLLNVTFVTLNDYGI